MGLKTHAKMLLITGRWKGWRLNAMATLPPATTTPTPHAYTPDLSYFIALMPTRHRAICKKSLPTWFASNILRLSRLLNRCCLTIFQALLTVSNT